MMIFKLKLKICTKMFIYDRVNSNEKKPRKLQFIQKVMRRQFACRIEFIQERDEK